VNKLLDERFRDLAMWCIAVLVNTSTWNEMMHNWKLICYVFLELHVGSEDVNQEYQDALVDKISKTRADPNIYAGIKFAESDQSESETNDDPFDYDGTDDALEYNNKSSMYQNTSSKKKNNRVSCLNNKNLSKVSHVQIQL
jgi:hypothetical protein